MTTLTQQIREYMQQCIEAGDCTDSAGVISPTQLAEAACDEFDAWTEDDEIPELFFEIAYQEAEKRDPAIRILANASAAEWILKNATQTEAQS